MNKPTYPSPSLQISASPELWKWLQQQQISIALTTYQTNRLIFLGSKPEVGLTVHEQKFDKPMGLYADDNSLYMSTRFQIWRLDNFLLPGETHQEADRLYIPSQSYTTGDLNVHDLVLDATGTPLFINTDFSCLATLKSGYSFTPVWQPPFISKLVAEDRCHLNGLAMAEGKPAYVTACSATDHAAGWRDHRVNGGIVLHIPSDQIIANNLSMPHSPRWYQDKLWLLNAGTGELGYLDDSQFVPITFCPGFVRGLAFWGNYALVGMSKLRSRNFTGLALETRLRAEEKDAECGLLVIDLKNGEIVHWLRFESVIEELFDIVVLPGVRQPNALGLETEDIQRLITFPGANGIVTSKPRVKPPSLNNGEIPKSATFKFQQVYHLNAESLAPYDAYTFPSLQARWKTQPQRGELVGVSASMNGEMVGFAIAELLPNFQGELISLFVAPLYRHQGLATRMMGFLEQELLRQKIRQIEVVYQPTTLTQQALEPMLQRLGWQPPTLSNHQLKRAYKLFPSPANQINPAARSQFEKGKQLAKQGNIEQAIICLQTAINLQPDYIAAYNQLGNAWQILGKWPEAIAAYHQLLEINPNVAAAHSNLGAIWQLQNQNEKAMLAYQQAIQIQPEFALAHLNLGKLLATQGNLHSARATLQTALRLQPDIAETHHQLGNVLQQLGDIPQAIACFQNALQIQPTFIEALHSLGCLFLRQQELTQAQQCFEQILTRQPDHINAQINLGHVLKIQNQLPQALASYEQALKLNSEETYVLYQLEHLKLSLCDWDNYDQRMQTLQASILANLSREQPTPCQPLSLSYFPLPLKLHQAVAQTWVRPIIRAMKEIKALCAFTHPVPPVRKLRIGYLSADFREHPMGVLLHQIFQHHDRTQFEIYGYSLVNVTDKFTTQIQDGCDVFVDLSHLSPTAAARRIHADGIHILIDLLGYTTHSRPEILALEPAPIQIQYLGYPDTMGAEFMPYILADRWLIPPELAPNYTEQVLELPHAFIASTLEISSRPLKRTDFGLPADSFVFCCFNRSDKLDPHGFQVWMEILQQVPNSVLWLIESLPSVSQNLRQIAQQAGISPHRLVFTPRLPLGEYLAAYRLADLFLDTFIYNAGATAVNALQAGLPVLTCPGETFASRMAASICASAGLEQLICPSWSSYEQLAVHLAQNPQALAAVRAVLKNPEQLPLFQPQQWICQLESVYQAVWNNLHSQIPVKPNIQKPI
ncbi:TIGR03032 family protein [Anabaena aphanizomenioides LEGE 00250]|uniref:protein O-GlcNAc transferase n=1 Tax=Sphaerospermopsis aphanizomenoides LEGE 00250 TaxID=2777972 RepID=A0ABR9VI94_9CYAN|nr:TIGR03032 family protein [Sphaerospermopsis aphanizomenoides]MBE9238219.1 TIGR03032 family protein [Sphaerospermopsis aphanizomenoides LEGE 00250]